MSDYLFRDKQTQREYQRLRLIEQACDEASTWLLAATGVTSGWSCLEVGFGAGSILHWLADQVGESGRVTGVDRDTQYLRDTLPVQAEVLEAEFDTLEIASGSLDLIHARYVLIHNKGAIQMLSRMIDWLKPGGYLVLEEPDFESAEWIGGAQVGACQRVNQTMCQLFSSIGLDPGFGQHLPMQMRTHGMDMIHVETTVHMQSGGEPMARVMAESAEQLRAEYLQVGIASEADIQHYIDSALNPATLATYYTTVGAIGRKLVEIPLAS